MVPKNARIEIAINVYSETSEDYLGWRNEQVAD